MLSWDNFRPKVGFESSLNFWVAAVKIVQTLTI